MAVEAQERTQLVNELLAWGGQALPTDPSRL